MPNTGLIRGLDWGFANELFTILQREVIIIITFTIPKLSLLCSFPPLQKLSEVCHQAKCKKEPGARSPGDSTRGPALPRAGPPGWPAPGAFQQESCFGSSVSPFPLCPSSARSSQAQEVAEAQRRNQSINSYQQIPRRQDLKVTEKPRAGCCRLDWKFRVCPFGRQSCRHRNRSPREPPCVQSPRLRPLILPPRLPQTGPVLSAHALALGHPWALTAPNVSCRHMLSRPGKHGDTGPSCWFKSQFRRSWDRSYRGHPPWPRAWSLAVGTPWLWASDFCGSGSSFPLSSSDLGGRDTFPPPLLDTRVFTFSLCNTVPLGWWLWSPCIGDGHPLLPARSRGRSQG